MLLQIDTGVETEAGLRTAALLLTSLADIRFGGVPKTAEPVPPTNTFHGAGSQAQNLPRVDSNDSFETTYVPPPPLDGLPPADFLKGAPLPPMPSNVLPFVPPPPPLSEATATMTSTLDSGSSTRLSKPSTSPSTPLSAVLNASTASIAPMQYDSAGLPWDERIHQKKQSKKKDGTWKLQKGIDAALVTAVVSELATKRLPASIVPAAPPTTSGRVPAPPVEVTSVKINGQVVPPPPVDTLPLPPLESSGSVSSAPSVNVPPPPPPEFGTGSPAASVQAGASEMRMLLDKITAASQAKQITPQQVNAIVQQHGAPSLMALKNMPNLVPGVSQAIDLAIMGIG